MKSFLIIVLVIAVALVLFLLLKAHKEKRSASSIILENIFKLIPLTDRRVDANFQKALEANKKPYVLPDKVRSKYNIKEYDGYSDTFIMEPETKSSDEVIFYLHGGGYWSQPLSLHFVFFNKLINRLGISLVLPVYPKAPAYTATDAHKMVMDRYLHLINDKKIPADKIILMGESAGAGLGLALLERLRDEKIPMPKQAIFISPWFDVTTENALKKEIQPHDPLLDNDILSFSGITYGGDLGPKNPLVSPLFGDLDNLPPMTVFTGTHDILYADAKKIEDIAKEKNLNITVHTYLNMNHGFVGFPVIPEAKQSFEVVIKTIENS
ncbi:alpha/beta hydrolase [Lentilactobacillus sp. Marseille-Q4993]|uniref:alpha/beta hydrolase n=1 Tax=Lentilactobacillus sp. Marseille-Q4993 TaxID=3039492 RepID=UPI0024BD0492|nr:alpha/beta hydrolase [Lentilactobacillus sp. Marseille-Q4993]